MEMTLKTNLELACECDGFPYPTDSTTTTNSDASSTTTSSTPDHQYWSFRHRGTFLGHVPAFVFDRVPDWDPTVWQVDHATRSIELRGTSTESRTQDLAGFLTRLRDQGVFGVLSGWRDEVYPIYGPGRELVVSMERSATPLFGVVTYGVHLTAFVGGGNGNTDMKIWVPSRATGKHTYPGMLDNTVAGGLATGEKPFDCLIREAAEEASFPEELIRQKAVACGTVTCIHLRDHRAGGETGLCQPECRYVYDLDLGPKGIDDQDVIPKPNDKEVQKFELTGVDQVKAALAEGRFKPNCAGVLLDFFIRHGILTAENEPDYIEIVSRLHRRLGSPTA